MAASEPFGDSERHLGPFFWKTFAKVLQGRLLYYFRYTGPRFMHAFPEIGMGDHSHDPNDGRDQDRRSNSGRKTASAAPGVVGRWAWQHRRRIVLERR
jgi:hypothetical protein